MCHLYWRKTGYLEAISSHQGGPPLYVSSNLGFPRCAPHLLFLQASRPTRYRSLVQAADEPARRDISKQMTKPSPKKKKKASLKNHQGSCWSYFISACTYQTCVPLWVSFTEFLLRKHLIAPPWCVPEFMEAMSASMHKLSLGDSFWFLGLQCFISGVSGADWIPRLPTGWPFFSLHVVQSWIIGPRGDLHREAVSCT